MTVKEPKFMQELHKMLLSYKQGKISLGTLAKKLGVSLSEVLDLLASIRLRRVPRVYPGVNAPILASA